MEGMLIVGFAVVAGVLALCTLLFWVILRASDRSGADASPAWSDPSPRRVLVVLTTDCVDDRVCARIAGDSEPVEVRVAVPLL